jgi:hypothetical protein
VRRWHTHVLCEARGRFQIVILEQSRCLPHLFQLQKFGQLGEVRRHPAALWSLVVFRFGGLGEVAGWSVSPVAWKRVAPSAGGPASEPPGGWPYGPERGFWRSYRNGSRRAWQVPVLAPFHVAENQWPFLTLRVARFGD